ncbi:MAG: Two-component system sensor histidine kinase, partial [uncultured Thermoleophilia bacterium]
ATVPLLWRRSAPQLALVAIVAGVFACLATITPYDVVVLPLLVSAYSVAVTGDRLRSALTAVVVVATTAGAVAPYLDEGADWSDGLFNAVALVLAVVTGEAVRARRAVRLATLAREAERERNQRAEALRMVAEERLRIAQEVHDVVAHAMVAINVQAGMAAHVLDRSPERTRAALRAIKDASSVALTDLAGTLGALRDHGDAVPFRPTGSLSGLEELAAPLRGAGIDVEVAVKGPEDLVPAAIGAAAYRIVQEATTNILRHAGARRASITVEVTDDAVDLAVEDDGAALAPVGGPVDAGTGNGLRGMTERAATLGGRLDAGRRPDGGWRVHAVLPR